MNPNVNFVCCENPNGDIVLAINTISIQKSNDHIIRGNPQVIADRILANPQVIADNNREAHRIPANPQVIADNIRANQVVNAQVAIMMRVEKVIGIFIIKIIILCVILSMIFYFNK
jgi:hypothetical protein